MRTTSRTTYALLVATFVVSIAASQARAWNPPPGPAIDQATPPPTPTTLLRQAHGYIIQNGISILDNDGYWSAAQMLRQWQQELLNGVRYADVYDGRQKVVIKIKCFYFFNCYDLKTVASWPLAADNHYFRPGTGRGLDPGNWDELSEWLEWTPVASLEIEPELEDGYPSALQMFDEEYAYALHAYFGRSAPEKAHPLHASSDRSAPKYNVGGRQGTALAMFYLGWASHLMQDQTVVHHTFDEPRKHHAEYENAADGFVTSPPIAKGQQMGIYDNQLPVLDCTAGSRTCFASYAAHVSHNKSRLDKIDQEDYSNVRFAIPFAQNLQAGLYAAFLTDIGLPPVHMSAIMSTIMAAL